MKEVVAIFEKYKLVDKPFEIALLDYEMAGRQQEWKQLVKRLESAFKGNECKFIVLQGKYGLGKTYTIERLYRFFEEKKKVFEDVFIVRTTLAEAPIRAYPGEPAKPKFGLDFVNRIFKHIEFSRLVEIVKKSFSKQSPKLSEPGFKFFTKVKEGDKVAYNVLSGIEVTASELKASGLKTLKDSQTALEILFDFQRILKAAGYNNFLILLDEFEYIPTLSTPKVTIILDTFRNIFDRYGILESREPNTLAKIVFVFAISPGGWERMKDLEASAVKRTGGGGIAPFMDRISKIDVINLNPLTPKEVEDLVKYRLEKHRIKGEKVPHPLFPFTKECVEFIASVSQGVPRVVLQYCGILLEDAAEKGKEEITLEYAKEVLTELGLYEELKGKA
jgi:hypothetical protein